MQDRQVPSWKPVPYQAPPMPIISDCELASSRVVSADMQPLGSSYEISCSTNDGCELVADSWRLEHKRPIKTNDKRI